MTDNASNAVYTVLQFLPSTARGEIVNVGIIAADNAHARCELLSSWRRVQSFSGDALSGVRLILDRLCQRAPNITIETLEELAARDHGAIRFTPLRQSTLPLDRLATEMARLYLVDVKSTTVSLRGRSEVKAIVKSHARSAIRQIVHEDVAVEHLIGTSIQGEVGPHTFDAVLGNGKKTGLLHGISFEEGEPGHLLEYSEAVAFRVSDVLSIQPGVGAGIMMLEPRHDVTPNYSKVLQSFEMAQKALTSVTATLLDEKTVDPWLETIARKAAPALLS